LYAHYLLANRAQIAKKDLIMKRYSLAIGIIVAAVTCSNLLAQDLRSGEKMGGKVAGVTENVVHLSNLTGAEFFDGFIDVKDISAVVVRVAR